MSASAGGSKSKRAWKVASADDVKAAALSQTTGLSPLVVRICLRRGLETKEQIEAFLEQRLDQLTESHRIKDLTRGVERLARARERGEKILIFGDYDVDGTTGAALLTWVFREMGFQSRATQPDRFRDGYGLNVEAVEAAHAAGETLLVTVDCGISSFAAIERANELGVDVIIVDHHQLDAIRGVPPAYAVIDPQRADCESGLKQLCGCGLAFYLSIALRAYGRDHQWFAPGSEPNLKQHLDLVTIATAADMVPLIGDNRILMRAGLEVIRRSRKPGVRALMHTSGLDAKDFSLGQLGFTLAPRINASGRMESASIALELLTTEDQRRASELAAQIERLNQERAAIQDQIWDQVRARVETGLAQGMYRHGIVVGDPDWHEGVVGIVASRVTETFQKPAIVLSVRDDVAKGSARTWAGKDVLEALRTVASRMSLKGFGGHRHAAGVSFEPAQLSAFVQAFDDAVGALPQSEAPPLEIETQAEFSELNVEALRELERLGPFGPGNPEPLILVRAQVQDHRILKGRHLKLNLGPMSHEAESEFKNFSSLEAVWFYAVEKSEAEQLDQDSQNASVSALVGGVAEWVGVPELNRFRGRIKPSLRVKDRRTPPLL